MPQKQERERERIKLFQHMHPIKLKAQSKRNRDGEQPGNNPGFFFENFFEKLCCDRVMHDQNTEIIKKQILIT